MPSAKTPFVSVFFIFGGPRRDIGSFGQQGADVLGIFYLLLSIAKLHRGLSSRLVKEEEEEDFLLKVNRGEHM